MSDQQTDKETQEQTDQNLDIEDLPVEDAAATQVKGGPTSQSKRTVVLQN
jgi:hypothetical protein